MIIFRRWPSAIGREDIATEDLPQLGPFPVLFAQPHRTSQLDEVLKGGDLDLQLGGSLGRCGSVGDGVFELLQLAR
jgi:hypothetical protein